MLGHSLVSGLYRENTMTDLRIQISDALVAAHNGSIDQSGFRRDVDNIMAALSNHGKQQARIAELTEALELADGVLSGANMNRAVVERKVRAALGDGV